MNYADYVVVLLTGSQCDEYPDTRCVMEVLGPYSREDAERVAVKYREHAEWTSPHLMRMSGREIDFG